jgi:acetolactate synthase-1/2/3 large subunit/sulfoacetaldehyde acetyltransferase
MNHGAGGNAVVEALAAHGTQHVFELIGSAGIEVFDALYGRTDIRFADGYARAAGRAGVFLADHLAPAPSPPRRKGTARIGSKK